MVTQHHVNPGEQRVKVVWSCCTKVMIIEWIRERTEHLDIFLFFPPITRWFSISDVLFIGGRGVSDFNVLKYY